MRGGLVGKKKNRIHYSIGLAGFLVNKVKYYQGQRISERIYGLGIVSKFGFNLINNKHFLMSLDLNTNLNFKYPSIFPVLSFGYGFNMLNSIYALALKKLENIVDAISKTSDLMRYNLEESQKRFVSLNQELDYLEDYINKLFKITPTLSDSYSMNTRRFSYYGNHRIILFHINSDLAALYEESDNTSQNISNPYTEINNAFGIFTGINSDTLYLQVEPH